MYEYPDHELMLDAETGKVRLGFFGGDGSFPVFGQFENGELNGVWISLAAEWRTHS